MAKTLIRKVQIRDPYLLSGQVSSGNPIIFSGDVALVSGDLSSPTLHTQSGYFDELTVSGNIISPYLSGLIGQYSNGSGIHVFSSPVDPSGNNLNFYLTIGSGDLTTTVKEFSTEDSTEGWEYLDGTTWSPFPILGLTLAQQQIATVKHTFVATGFDTQTQYYVGIKPIFAGSITGSYYQSAAFYPDTQGYEVTTPPSLGQIYENMDTRYVQKALTNGTYVASGVTISGLPFFFPSLSSAPTVDVTTGMAYWNNATSGLFVYQADVFGSGWKRINVITQLSGVSGIVIPTATGIVKVAPLYGTGINTICQGNDGRLFSSGHQAGSPDPLNVNNLSGVLQTGQRVEVFITGDPSIGQLASGIRFAGSSFSFAWDVDKLYVTSNALTRVTGNANGFWTADNAQNSGTLYVSGQYPLTAAVQVAAPPASPYYDFLQLSYLGLYGITTPESGSTFHTDKILISGSGGNYVYTAAPVNGSGMIVVAYTGAGGGAAGGVTGFGVNSDPLYTGGFRVSGAGSVVVTQTSMAAGISGIVISGSAPTTTLTSTFLEIWNTIGY